MSDDDEGDSGESEAREELPDSVRDTENLDIAANSDRSEDKEGEREGEQVSNDEN